MKKNDKKTTASVSSGFYNSALTTQGQDGEHKRYPIDFYTENPEKKLLADATKDFLGDFYKTDKD